MRAYVYKAALYCEDCASKIIAAMDSALWQTAFGQDDSNVRPQGPYPDGGGEADCPQHCDACGVFLENPLTKDGEDYVRIAASPCLGTDTPAPPIPAAWREHYSYLFT